MVYFRLTILSHLYSKWPKIIGNNLKIIKYRKKRFVFFVVFKHAIKETHYDNLSFVVTNFNMPVKMASLLLTTYNVLNTKKSMLCTGTISFTLKPVWKDTADLSLTITNCFVFECQWAVGGLKPVTWSRRQTIRQNDIIISLKHVMGVGSSVRWTGSAKMDT